MAFKSTWTINVKISQDQQRDRKINQNRKINNETVRIYMRIESSVNEMTCPYRLCLSRLVNSGGKKSLVWVAGTRKNVNTGGEKMKKLRERDEDREERRRFCPISQTLNPICKHNTTLMIH